ncbi:MAG: hypothetical protein JW843_01810 [Candidatus Aminicenantes bacterium]|nr:hypothetical protein [Candidatus Aminicenantes bacterium]
MRARDIVLALLVIGLGVFLTYAKSGRLDDLFFDLDGPWLGVFDEYTYEESREIDGPVPAEIQVLNARGAIEVSAAGGPDKAVVHFKKRVYARSRADADAIAESLRLNVVSSPDRLVLSTNREEFRRKRFSTEFKILVPPQTAVVLKNSYGPVRIEGTGRSEIRNPHGEVLVRGIVGPLELFASYGGVDVDGVRDDVRMSAPHGDVDIRNVEGSVDLDHSYGRVGLDRIARRTIVRGSHSQVTASNLADEAEIASTYERIIISSAKSIKVRAGHCDIAAKAVDGGFDVTNSYGRVRIDGLTGDLRVDGNNVEVDGLDLRAGTIFVRTTYKNVSLAGFSGPAEVIFSHAGLTLAPAPVLSGGIGVQGEYADVRLVWPAGFRAPFEARTRNGRIIWSLEEKPDSETSNGTTEVLAFSAETGKPKVAIATSHGDIRVDAAGR